MAHGGFSISAISFKILGEVRAGGETCILESPSKHFGSVRLTEMDLVQGEYACPMFT